MLIYRNHSNHHSNHFCIPSIRTSTFKIIIPISEHLHLVELEWGLPNVYQPLTVSVELERGLPNVFQHTTGVFEHLLDYYCHRGARTGFAKPVPAFNSHCGAQMGIAKCVLAFDSLCGALTGVAKTCNSLRQSLRGLNGGRKRATVFDRLC